MKSAEGVFGGVLKLDTWDVAVGGRWDTAGMTSSFTPAASRADSNCASSARPRPFPSSSGRTASTGTSATSAPCVRTSPAQSFRVQGC